MAIIGEGIEQMMDKIGVKQFLNAYHKSYDYVWHHMTQGQQLQWQS